MFKLIISATLVAMATACCIPKQWEAYLGFQSGTWENTKKNGSSYEGTSKMYFDAVNKLVAYDQTVNINDQYFINQTLVLDYNQKNLFIIKDDGSCERYELGDMQPQCFPDTDPSSALFTYGFGSNSVLARSFTYTANDTTTYMMVTADACTPLTTNTVMRTNEVYQATTTVFTGVKAGISDRRVFNVPVSCTNTQVPTNGKLPGFEGKRSVLF